MIDNVLYIEETQIVLAKCLLYILGCSKIKTRNEVTIMEDSATIYLRVPKKLKRIITKIAKKKGVAVNPLLTQKLTEIYIEGGV